MAVFMSTVELTGAQIRTIYFLGRKRKKTVVEQAQNVHANSHHTTTYFRVGEGKGKREWVVLRNGKTKENPTPGKGKVT